MPKAGIDGRTFDLRVLVIAGRARHAVARLSRGPMTNLHLLNERGDPARVARIAASWDERRTVRQVREYTIVTGIKEGV
jgi:hypothetical protein